MSQLKNSIIFTLKNGTGVFYWMRESRRWVRDYISFRKEAKRLFQEDCPKVGSFQDYLRALRSHRFTYGEYMRYELWRLSKEERYEFISMAEMSMVYRKMVSNTIKALFNEKSSFLKKYKDFVYRKWVYVPEATADELKELLSTRECIIKPVQGFSGWGVRRFERTDETDWNQLYEDLSREQALVEECIYAADEIEEFHPASLNTLRVVTMSKGKEVRFIGAILRMGVHGSCIDNSHAGGIFAKINLDTGVIESEGVDMMGNEYICHPDSGKTIKGVIIPYWKEVKNICIKATQVVPNLFMGGWDICVHQDGTIELIEGNCVPHFDGGMQLPLRQGVRRKLKGYLDELYGIGNMI